MTPLSHYMPAPRPEFAATKGAHALPARIDLMPQGGAWVTIGEIRSPYANAKAAQRQLAAMEARGLVRLERATEEASC